METVKKTNPESKKDWLERECEELGITYLGKLSLKKKETSDAFYSGLPRPRNGSARQLD